MVKLLAQQVKSWYNGMAVNEIYLYYHPVDLQHQHRPTADVSRLIPVQPGFHEPS
jgi:hypothetical protein